MNTAEPTNLFLSWPLSQDVQKAIADMGYTQPTPVQEACIPYLLENNTDLLALAKTGTGKTAAFGLPLVEKLSTETRLQALVLCPTRELAAQVAQNLQQFGARKGLKVVSILGGESYRRQIEALKNKPQILVSTPGRLIDLMEQGAVQLAGVERFILDEADEMLSFGFQDALETIWTELSNQPFTTWLFSATMSDSILRLAKKYLKNPYEVKLNSSEERIRVSSYAAVVYEEDKEDALALLIQNEPQFYGIIFAQTKQQVANLELRLRSMGFHVESLHGDKVQAERTRTIGRMKKREIQILVATDVAARGLDIEDLTHVVNFELPWDVETYTHRIGRTARAGKEGTVWTFVRPKESAYLRKFERALKFEFKTLKVPSVEDVRSLQIQRWLKDVAKTQVSSRDQDLYELSFTEDVQQNMGAIVPETRDWLMKALSFMKVGAGANLRQPRSFDLRPREKTYSRPPSHSSGPDSFRGDRGPRREYGPRREDGPRREYGPRREDGPRREYGPRREDGPRREYAPRGEEGPRREYGPRRDDGPRRGPSQRRDFGQPEHRDQAPRSSRPRRGSSRDASGKWF